MAATIQKRTRDEAPISDAMCTPRWLNEKLGRFDIDPASNDRSTVNADWAYSLEKHLDGLKLPWRGRAFLNHPYGDPDPWMDKAIYELRSRRCTELVNLTKLDPSTDWWAVITQPIEFDGVLLHPELWAFNKRLQFDEPIELVEMRKAKRAAAIHAVEETRCPREGCYAAAAPWHGVHCATRTGAPHLERAKAAGITIPSETTSNNFCSAIIHHRGRAPMLDLEEYATCWVRGV